MCQIFLVTYICTHQEDIEDECFLSRHGRECLAVDREYSWDAQCTQCSGGRHERAAPELVEKYQSTQSKPKRFAEYRPKTDKIRHAERLARKRQLERDRWQSEYGNDGIIEGQLAFERSHAVNCEIRDIKGAVILKNQIVDGGQTASVMQSEIPNEKTMLLSAPWILKKNKKYKNYFLTKKTLERLKECPKELSKGELQLMWRPCLEPGDPREDQDLRRDNEKYRALHREVEKNPPSPSQSSLHREVEKRPPSPEKRPPTLEKRPLTPEKRPPSPGTNPPSPSQSSNALQQANFEVTMYPPPPVVHASDPPTLPLSLGEICAELDDDPSIDSHFPLW